MRVAISGSSGLIGAALTAALSQRGDEVLPLGRRTSPLSWDPESGPPPPAALDVDAFVHLAGEPIATRRWSAAQKRRIRDSRVVGTRNLVEAINRAASRPAALLSASAIGYYGDRADEPLDERSPPGDDFLARVCRDWEAEAERARARVVRLRTGIVLARQGGALPLLARPFRFFVGGPLGGGRQWVSWIHLDDHVGLILRLLDDRSASGAVNLVAPRPVRNAELARTIGRVLGRPALLPVPRPALALLLGERVEALLASQRASAPPVYKFRFSALTPALRDLLDR